MAYRTAPFITPFAIMSAVLALGATNVAVNTVTHTSEGKVRSSAVSSVSQTSSSMVSEKSKPEDERASKSSMTSSEEQLRSSSSKTTTSQVDDVSS